MFKKLGLVVFFLLITTPFLVSCGHKSAIEQITVVGSTALQPLVEQAANDYQKNHQNVSITVQGGGSGTGLNQVDQGAVTIGNSDVFAEQQKGIHANRIVDHQVAVSSLAPVVNPQVGVKNVSLQQLQKIFTGKITNWQELGGKNTPIFVINRAPGSGSRKQFEAAILKGQSAIQSQEQDSNGTIQRIVSTTPGAISYLSFSYITPKLQALSVNGIRPTAKTVASNQWPIWSYEHMYTQKRPSGVTKDFIKYIQSPAVQKRLVAKLKYISIHDMQYSQTPTGKIIPKEPSTNGSD